jgi:hypothetical protein
MSGAQCRFLNSYDQQSIDFIKTREVLIGSGIEKVRLERENRWIEQKLRDREVFKRPRRTLQDRLQISEEAA